MPPQGVHGHIVDSRGVHTAPKRGILTSVSDAARLNEDIDAELVYLIDHDGTDLGLKTLNEARSIALERQLDLVEVAANARPPVCRLMDFAAWKREQDERRPTRRGSRPLVAAAQVAAEVIGLGEDLARARVEAAGLIWRVVKRDGTGIPVRADRRPDRLSVEVTNGIVIAATVG
jgi:hypothetical protein